MHRPRIQICFLVLLLAGSRLLCIHCLIKVHDLLQLVPAVVCGLHLFLRALFELLCHDVERELVTAAAFADDRLDDCLHHIAVAVSRIGRKCVFCGAELGAVYGIVCHTAVAFRRPRRGVASVELRLLLACRRCDFQKVLNRGRFLRVARLLVYRTLNGSLNVVIGRLAVCHLVLPPLILRQIHILAVPATVERRFLLRVFHVDVHAFKPVQLLVHGARPVLRHAAGIQCRVQEVFRRRAGVFLLLPPVVQRSRKRFPKPRNLALHRVQVVFPHGVAVVGVAHRPVNPLCHAGHDVWHKTCCLRSTVAQGGFRNLPARGLCLGVFIAVCDLLKLRHSGQIHHALKSRFQIAARNVCKRQALVLVAVCQQRAIGHLRVDRVEEANGYQVVTVAPLRAFSGNPPVECTKVELCAAHALRLFERFLVLVVVPGDVHHASTGQHRKERDSHRAVKRAAEIRHSLRLFGCGQRPGLCLVQDFDDLRTGVNKSGRGVLNRCARNVAGHVREREHNVAETDAAALLVLDAELVQRIAHSAHDTGQLAFVLERAFPCGFLRAAVKRAFCHLALSFQRVNSALRFRLNAAFLHLVSRDHGIVAVFLPRGEKPFQKVSGHLERPAAAGFVFALCVGNTCVKAGFNVRLERCLAHAFSFCLGEITLIRGYGACAGVFRQQHVQPDADVV